ncbi:MAG: AbrB/MazE/SpoVT family DNA-binding domain-containing protein [Oscillospiraceae bacterium]|nr:AbrB/MazE/SpoVT family DNA-binding domain-containing protein [Oscillospiraceae bacterium]
MKATGIVRRIDDLGRVVIPKEIRRTMRIREGDPLEIYTTREGEVIFKKYSLISGIEEFAGHICETLSKSTGSIVAVADRDSIIALHGGARRELMGKPVSEAMEEVMTGRGVYVRNAKDRPLYVTEGNERLFALVAAPILAEGDVLGLVLFVGDDPAKSGGETEQKLAQTIANFLGKHMEV